MSVMRPHILGVGNPFCDRVAFVSDAFLAGHGLRKNDTNPTDDFSAVERAWNASQVGEGSTSWSLGGSGANVIKVLARLGQQCSLYGKVGKDSSADTIASQMEGLGIRALLSRGEKGTGVVNCFVDSSTGDRTMQTYLGVSSEELAVDPEQFTGATHVHLEGYTGYTRLFENSLAAARSSGATVSLDLASCHVVTTCKSRLEENLRGVDLLFGNLEEMKLLTGHGTAILAAEHFDSKKTVVVTDGENGCAVKWKGESKAGSFLAHRVKKVVDTTGAGDFFVGGFLHGVLQGKEMDRCVELGNLAASAVIGQQGAELPDAEWPTLVALAGKV